MSVFVSFSKHTVAGPPKAPTPPPEVHLSEVQGNKLVANWRAEPAVYRRSLGRILRSAVPPWTGPEIGRLLNRDRQIINRLLRGYTRSPKPDLILDLARFMCDPATGELTATFQRTLENVRNDEANRANESTFEVESEGTRKRGRQETAAQPAPLIPPPVLRPPSLPEVGVLSESDDLFPAYFEDMDHLLSLYKSIDK